MFLIMLLCNFVETPTIRGSLSNLKIYLLTLIFVDDTNLFIFAYANELILDTALRLQHIVLV